jgi:hypothetical protein
MNEPQHFRLIEFNERRAIRGADAARVEVETSGMWLWMSKRDLRANMKEFGPHPELQKALDIYKAFA